ncbi:hypothetical protein C8F01DRAFT_702173 [Mycena amicta]|nr:hypothetical protein C8F01DRAFT_702173 [Mycena amicta]
MIVTAHRTLFVVFLVRISSSLRRRALRHQWFEYFNLSVWFSVIEAPNSCYFSGLSCCSKFTAIIMNLNFGINMTAVV